MLSEQSVSERSCSGHFVIGCGDDHDKLLRGEGVHFVATRAVHRKPLELPVAQTKGGKPPEIAVIGVFERIGMRSHRSRHPIGGDDAVSPPGSSVQIELTELKEIATAQEK